MTKKRPAENTREQELMAQLDEHRAKRAAIESEALDLRSQASAAKARIEELLVNFDRPAEGVPEELRACRREMAEFEVSAEYLDRRATAYWEQFGVDVLASEYEQLRSQRIENEARSEAMEEAEGLMAEIELRSAWVYANTLALKATEITLQAAVDRLNTLHTRYRLTGIDLGRFARLPGECATIARQGIHILGAQIAEPWLPELESLPEEWLQLPEGTKSAAPTTPSNQITRAPFDPTRPKDHAIRMAAAVTPSPRNEDGTLAGVLVRDPFATDTSHNAPRPRTAAEDRAAHRKVAAEIAAEDGG